MNVLDRIRRPDLVYTMKQGSGGRWWCFVQREGDPDGMSRLTTPVPGFSTRLAAESEMAALGIRPREEDER